MKLANILFAFMAFSGLTQAETLRRKHHKKHHKKHNKQDPKAVEKEMLKKVNAMSDAVDKAEAKVDVVEKVDGIVITTDTIKVNGPLPADFPILFKQSTAAATKCEEKDIMILNTQFVDTTGNVIVAVTYKGPKTCVDQIRTQAAESDSELSKGALRPYLVAKDPTDAISMPPGSVTPGVDVDTEMPFGELEPFGREDTAHELTESSIHESDAMVDQMERAEVAEEKRSVFRALTRLRGAAITSFDGVARSQTGNIDEYNKVHKWRKTHPLAHLAAQESDVTKWAFPISHD